MSQAGSFSSGGGGGGGTLTLTYVAVNSNYTLASGDTFVNVDSSSGPITIKLPNAPAIGRVFIIKDGSGNASTNNITVTTVSGTVLIDGATTFVFNSDFESAQFIFGGSYYSIF